MGKSKVLTPLVTFSEYALHAFEVSILFLGETICVNSSLLKNVREPIWMRVKNMCYQVARIPSTLICLQDLKLHDGRKFVIVSGTEEYSTTIHKTKRTSCIVTLLSLM